MYVFIPFYYKKKRKLEHNILKGMATLDDITIKPS